MKVSQLAKLAHVTPETVRYYTRKGLLTASKNPRNGYKIYDSTALKHLQFIAQARALNFNLKDIRHILDNAKQGLSPCPLVRRLLVEKIQQTEKEITQLQSKLALMRAAHVDWQSKLDALPSELSICHLIESVTDE